MNQALSALSHNNPVERFCFLTDHLGTPKEIFTEAGRLVWAVDHGHLEGLRMDSAYRVPRDRMPVADFRARWRRES